MTRFILPKKHLLKTTGEFQRVYRLGQRLRGNNFVMIFLSNEEGCTRLGISVQKKTGNAVRRNRIKRLIRESFRLNQDQLPPSCDIVFTVRPGFAINSLVDMQADLTRIVGSSKQAGGTPLDR